MTHDNKINLDQFLKLQRVVQSGGEAKMLIKSGAVSVNGETELRRGRQLLPGDVIEYDGQEWKVEVDE